MKNLSISKKLIFTFGIAIALFCLTVITGIVGLTQIKSSYNTFYSTQHDISVTALTMNSQMNSAVEYLSLALSDGDTHNTNAYIEKADACFDQMNTLLAQLENDLTDEKGRELIADLSAKLEVITDFYDELIGMVSGNTSTAARAAVLEQAKSILIKKFAPVLNENQKILDELIANTEAVADNTYKTAMASATGVTILMFAVSIIALAITLTLAARLIRSLVAPLKEIQDAAAAIENGILDINVTYESNDELGQLAENIRTMSQRLSYYVNAITTAMASLAEGNLNIPPYDPFLGDFLPVQTSIRKLINTLDATLYQINQAAGQVASGSDQVASGAQALSQGATEQASSVEELAATIGDLSTQVQSTSDHVEDIRDQVDIVNDEMSSCNSQMQEMTAAMAEITHKSNEISKIIKTIEDIAFQTNILALNAAVEAARAGSAGKGFAVVADEVRNLASKSQDASKNTSILIESSAKAVEKGKNLADSTAEFLVRVVSSAQAVGDIISKIADNTASQSAALSQVSQGVDQISSVVQTNSATAEESAAASQELSGQSQLLKDLVGQFQLTASAGSASAAGLTASAGIQPEPEASGYVTSASDYVTPASDYVAPASDYAPEQQSDYSLDYTPDYSSEYAGSDKY